MQGLGRLFSFKSASFYETRGNFSSLAHLQLEGKTVQTTNNVKVDYISYGIYKYFKYT
jgi:hypothetical protein